MVDGFKQNCQRQTERWCRICSCFVVQVLDASFAPVLQLGVSQLADRCQCIPFRRHVEREKESESRDGTIEVGAGNNKCVQLRLEARLPVRKVEGSQTWCVFWKNLVRTLAKMANVSAFGKPFSRYCETRSLANGGAAPFG